VYSDTVDKLKDAVTDLNNERVLSRALGKTNEELEFKFKELQRSIVSRAPYQLPAGAYSRFRIGALLSWY
jgi:hypothetical protein